MKKLLCLSGCFLLTCACVPLLETAGVFNTPQDYNWRFILEEPKPSTPQTYSDEFVDMEFTNTYQTINIQLQNKTDSPMTIDWNLPFLTTPNGEISRLAEFGKVKFKDKDKIQPPTIVPPNSRVLLNLYRPDMWVDAGYITPRAIYNLVAVEDSGKLFGVFFPLGFKGVNKLYDFKFRIDISWKKGSKKK